MSGAKQNFPFPLPTRHKTRGKSHQNESSGFYGTVTMPLNPLMDRFVTTPPQERLHSPQPIVRNVLTSPGSQRSRPRGQMKLASSEEGRVRSADILSDPQRYKQQSFLQKDMIALKETNTQLINTEKLLVNQSQYLEEFGRMYQESNMKQQSSSSENINSSEALNNPSELVIDEHDTSSPDVVEHMQSLPSEQLLEEQHITSLLLSSEEDHQKNEEAKHSDEEDQTQIQGVELMLASNKDIVNKDTSKQDSVDLVASIGNIDKNTMTSIKRKHTYKRNTDPLLTSPRKHQMHTTDLSSTLEFLPILGDEADFDTLYSKFQQILPPVSLATSASTHEQVLNQSLPSKKNGKQSLAGQNLNILPDYHLSLTMKQHEEQLKHAVDTYTHQLSLHMSDFVKKSVLHLKQNQLLKLQENKRKLHETLRWYHENESVLKDLCGELNNYDDVRAYYDDEISHMEDEIDDIRKMHLEKEIREAAEKEEKVLNRKTIGDNMDFLKKSQLSKKAEFEACLSVFHTTRNKLVASREKQVDAKHQYDNKQQQLRENVREEIDMLTEEGLLIQQTRAQNKTSLHNAEKRIQTMTSTKLKLQDCFLLLQQLRMQCEKQVNEKQDTVHYIQKLKGEIFEKSNTTVRKIQDQCCDVLKQVSKSSKDAMFFLQSTQDSLLSALHCRVCKQPQPHGNIVLETNEVVCTDCMGYYQQHAPEPSLNKTIDENSLSHIYMQIFLSQPPPQELLLPEPLDEDVEWSMASARANPDDPIAMNLEIERLRQERVELLLENYKPIVPKVLPLPQFKEAKQLFDSFQKEARDLLVSCQMTPMIMESYINSIQAVVASPDGINQD